MRGTMSKRKKRQREKRSAEKESGLGEAYLNDPIALWQDGEYEALDALYAERESDDGEVKSEPSKRRTTEGDSVRVKQGVMCPDFEGLSLAGWQGRIISVERGEDDDVMVGIKWDSVTLSTMPEEYVADSEAQGYDCTEMYLGMADVEPAQARDGEAEAQRSARLVESRSFWIGMGAQGKRILDVIGGTDADDPWEALEAWRKHLRKKLTFPLDAKVSEFQEHGPLADGDEVQVLAIEDVDDLMGVAVRIKRGWRKRVFPLCDLEVFPPESSAYLAVKDYCVWFANR